ncbi:MAG: NAD(P)-dependent oxidoreductase [Fibromonadaceae bacterium]|jgi:UDP-glucose 4-epimerase|nr:NAD(P)-dependent oxidoreductase [Fibromonadaceae bacterium]
MRIFLTGGTGFIGHFVAKEFLERGYSLRILARNPNKIPSLAKHEKVEMLCAGLLDSEAIKNGLKDCEACVHIALGWGETPLTMLANDTTVTAMLLELAAQNGCEKFIYTSSTAAFGKIRKNANEDMVSIPQDLYGATKASGEAYTLGFKKMKRNVIRPGYTFGHLAFPDGGTQPDRRFFNIAKAVRENQTVNLTKHDGTQFIHASQLAKLYVAVLESDVNEEVFFGLGTEWIGWKDIAERAIAMCPGTKAVIEEEDKGWGNEPSLFSLEKMEKFFGLKFNGNDFLDEHIKWNLEL